VHPLKKALKASDRRRTRFHTERGQLMPLSAWARLPRSVRARLRGAQQNEPWMVPAAVERLDDLIQPTWWVLEFGSGASTAWYAERAECVVSLEDDPEWYENVRKRLGTLASDKCDVRYVPLRDFPVVASQFSPSTFDLVVVDVDRPLFGGHALSCPDGR
jgi:protein-L-isoaspartate O-methyltransferase